MKIINIVTGAFGVNCYVVHKNDKAVVIDPGADPESILAAVSDNKLAVSAYILTHGHIDHISALNDLVSKVPAPVLISAADAKWAFGPQNCLQPMYPPMNAVPEGLREIADNEIIPEAPFELKALFTPGHTPGGVCLYAQSENTLFSGDTLFQNSVGRTDLPGGDEQTLMKSIAVLAALPENTKVYPGHGPSTTIGREKASNPFMPD